MDTWLVVGLGNPGPRYAGNRHNVGAMVVDDLASRHGSARLKTHKSRASIAEVRLGVLPGGAPGPKAVLAVPSSYMNESGGPVKALMQFFSIDTDHLVVIHDELDIPAGEVRLKKGGGEGGHNGLRSISSSLDTRDYLRVRVGIGRPPGRMEPADYVLRDFSVTERKDLPFLIGDAADATEQLVAEGLLTAQQRWHSPR
ncbi:aminoacyl-tRNA hydrolase [Knoellia sp. p5-6-4]|uniref:aminoacyl-tRNA hydrolase n=1 Tax=unclassified Knoellia TaxID=2618719 RepID=UPI0023DC5152|nr:aminoacyl-tRNA hydrolase [Knoellia sp. p5-6-4]MDF2146885.1 aminoacyl-tRNA hydrolase [Knoellia sp. p5-6-4]